MSHIRQGELPWLRTRRKCHRSRWSAPFAADAPNVIIETVKMAQDGKGLIVRLFENERNRRRITVSTGFTLAGAYSCNLLEENERELPIDGNIVQLDITPYQIQTLRLVRN